MRQLRILAVLVAVAGRAAAQQAGWPAFEAFYASACERHGIVGSSVALVRGGRVAARASHGFQELAARRPIDPDTIFHWASITKTLTGIAVMQLRDHGRLQLDDPALKYLPELRQVHDPFGDVSEITLRHLMTHSAGFRAGTWPWGGDKDWHPFEPTRYEQLLAMLPYTDVRFRPGSRHSYSNPGIVFLGRIIEQLSGDDWEVYVDKNILKPLEMHRSYFDRAPFHLAANRSHSYYRDDDGLREAPFDFDTGITVSNGGLMSPIPDMVKYLAFLLGAEPSQRARYDGVLKRSSLEEMWQPQLPLAGEDKGQEAIGLIFFLDRRGGRRLIGHSGDQGGFLSHLYLAPEASLGYVVNFNTEATSKLPGKPRDTRALDAEIRDFLLKNVWPPAARP
jgi:CubicO group peptidase (beta-lactamase class C family)